MDSQMPLQLKPGVSTGRESDETNMDTEAKEREQAIIAICPQSTIPVEIVPLTTCFGVTYYEWHVAAAAGKAHGVACSLSEALGEVREALHVLSTVSASRRR